VHGTGDPDQLNGNQKAGEGPVHGDFTLKLSVQASIRPAGGHGPAECKLGPQGTEA
jgi:hypothetical protein